MATTYTVVKGDNLTKIAKMYDTTVSELMKLNPTIKNKNLIYVGQVLTVKADAGDTTATVPASSNDMAKIVSFGLQADTDRTVFAVWSWNKSDKTENYKTRWWYAAADGTPILGNESTTTFTHSTYTAPSNAVRTWFHVLPESKTYKPDGNTETTYFTAKWSTYIEYAFKNNPPTAPSTPTVKIEDYKLTATVSDLENLNATHIHFEVLKDNSATVFATADVEIVTGYAEHTWNIDAGSDYKVRCYAYRGSEKSDWTSYSSNVGTAPSAPASITTIEATSETSVYLEWSKVENATSYDIQYGTNVKYFDVSSAVTTVTGIATNEYEQTGLESGERYYFRVRAVNSNGESAWTSKESVIIGTKPSPPTTWSSTTTAVVGDPVTLYWMHNSEDGSSQKRAVIHLEYNGATELITSKNTGSDDKTDKVYTHSLDTSKYPEGASVRWKVKTRGVLDEYSDWSIERTIDIYAPPTLELHVGHWYGDDASRLRYFPLCIYAMAGPNTQNAIGYYVNIIANEFYQTTDYVGNPMYVCAGDSVFSRHYDGVLNLAASLTPSDVDLENNISYTVQCSVTMNSGLSAEASTQFTVAWDDDDIYVPNASIGIDPVYRAAIIRPYCEDYRGNIVDTVTLSVYRRDYDSKFVEIIRDIHNSRYTYVTDPHPTLGLVYYRIVATSTKTGRISYYDLPGVYIDPTSIILQWNEAWTPFDAVYDGTGSVKPYYASSTVFLPYNVDVSFSHKPDVELVEYIGRSNPISYYGTQYGETATWNTDIAKTDTTTLAALRRLSKWMGDVYVREPSGAGYWAHVTVSFSRKHLETVIPVTLNITRVEGGV